jgi:hypothetical protein
MDFFNVDFDQFFILYTKKIEFNSYKLKERIENFFQTRPETCRSWKLTEKTSKRFHLDWKIGNRFFLTLDCIIHITSNASFIYITNVRMYKCPNDDNETNFFFLKPFFVAAGSNMSLEWLWRCSTVSYPLHPHQRLSLWSGYYKIFSRFLF